MDQVLILMRATAAGPNGTFSEGKQYPVDAALAQAWIDGGYAVRAPAKDDEIAAVVEAAVAAVATVETKAANVTALNHAQLVALAEERGLDPIGTDAELVERIAASTEPTPTQPDGDDDGADTGFDESAAVA